jgi:hypothetical protein
VSHDVSNPAARPANRGRLGWVLFWLLFLAGMGFLAGGLLHLRAAYEAAVMNWRKVTVPLTPQGAAFRDRIMRLEGEGKDPHDVAMSLGVELKPAAKWWPDNPRHEVRLAIDPASGFEFELSFLEGSLSGHRARPKFAPPPGMFLVALEHCRQYTRDCAWVAWLSVFGLFIALFMAPHWRRMLAHAALSLALASLVAAELSIPPGAPLAGRFLETVVIWSWAAMIPLSVGLFFWSRRPRPWTGEPLCPQCGYNLTGNTAGRCPECGSPIPRWLLRRIAAHGALATLDPDFEHIEDVEGESDESVSEEQTEERED